MNEQNPLVYVPTPCPEGGVRKFSPSAFSTFVERPWDWYRKEILDQGKFEGNTGSVSGTCVHYCAEKVAKGEEVKIELINDYIDMQVDGEDMDTGIVRGCYTEMAERLVNDYVHEHDFLEIETSHVVHLKDDYYVGGRIDRIEGEKSDCMPVDYKTYHSKTTPRTIPSYYKYQILVYAYILWKSGYNPTRIRIVYVNRHIEGEFSDKTGKQMKSYPPVVTVLTETITQDDLNFIEGQLMLCVDTCKLSDTNPELRHIIWHDPRILSKD